jgi:hypothetical protein
MTLRGFSLAAVESGHKFPLILTDQRIPYSLVIVRSSNCPRPPRNAQAPRSIRGLSLSCSLVSAAPAASSSAA